MMNVYVYGGRIPPNRSLNWEFINMIRAKTGRYRSAGRMRIVGLIFSFGACVTAHAQSVSTPIVSPVMLSPTVAKVGSNGPAQILDGGGHVFAASYDLSGRLTSLNATTGLNAHNLQVRYRSDGRVAAVLLATNMRCTSATTPWVAKRLEIDSGTP
jgi:hypothetical protein